jgi:hypothetical protein
MAERAVLEPVPAGDPLAEARRIFTLAGGTLPALSMYADPEMGVVVKAKSAAGTAFVAPPLSREKATDVIERLRRASGE